MDRSTYRERHINSPQFVKRALEVYKPTVFFCYLKRKVECFEILFVRGLSTFNHVLLNSSKTLALNYLPRKSPSKYCRRFITFHN